MDESARILADGLLKAIKAEREGQSFYRMAAETCRDGKAKEVFSQLAQEESDHAEFLTRHHEAVVRTGETSDTATLGKPLDLAESFPIFSDSIKARLGEAHFEMTALSIGIRLELDAVQFYKSQIDAVDDPGAKQFYSELAEWEAGHYQALLRQQEELKEDYWSAGGFSPF